MSKDFSIEFAEALLLFEREKAMAHIANVLLHDPTPEFREWLAFQIGEGRITLAALGRGRPTNHGLEAEVMRFVELNEAFDHEEKMDGMIAALKERHPGLGREKLRELIWAGLDLRQASEDIKRDHDSRK
jgi:hypothetical protein